MNIEVFSWAYGLTCPTDAHHISPECRKFSKIMTRTTTNSSKTTDKDREADNPGSYLSVKGATQRGRPSHNLKLPQSTFQFAVSIFIYLLYKFNKIIGYSLSMSLTLSVMNRLKYKVRSEWFGMDFYWRSVKGAVTRV